MRHSIPIFQKAWWLRSRNGFWAQLLRVWWPRSLESTNVCAEKYFKVDVVCGTSPQPPSNHPSKSIHTQCIPNRQLYFTAPLTLHAFSEVWSRFYCLCKSSRLILGWIDGYDEDIEYPRHLLISYGASSSLHPSILPLHLHRQSWVYLENIPFRISLNNCVLRVEGCLCLF